MIVVKNVRLSFPSLYKKAKFNGVETKYEASFLFPKDGKVHNKIEKELQKFKDNIFPDGAPKALKIRCLKDGDTVDYDGYEGMMSLKASNVGRPTLLNSSKTPSVEEDETFYAGCYVHASFEFWYSSHELGGKQILANLRGVMFAKDGESFGINRDATDDFDGIALEE